MKMRNRRKKLENRIKGFEVLQAKQSNDKVFHKPGSLKK